MRREHYIYAIGQEHGPIKIGVSCSPYDRVADLQTGCPFEIRLLLANKCKSRDLAFKREKLIHRDLEDRSLFGEWFSVNAFEAMTAVDKYFEADWADEFAAEVDCGTH